MTPALHPTAIPSRAPERAHEALTRLVEGNRRFREGPMEDRERPGFLGSEAAQEQQPFAAVLGCSDSRVPPQLVFDQGPGDLFTARVAGHVATDEVMATLEYAVAQLGVPLVVVLGHSRCGAVTACLHGGDEPPVGKLGTLLRHIEPAVCRARQEEGDALAHAIHFHVEHVVKQLRFAEPILRRRYEAGTLAIVGATYDLDTGAVRIVDAGTLDPVL